MPRKGYRQSPEHRAAIALGVAKGNAARRKWNEAEKFCSRCQQHKPLDAFGLGRTNGSGRQTYCRACRGRQAQERREHVSAYQRSWRHANQDELREAKRAYYLANRERIAAQERDKYLLNRDHKLAYQKAYYQQNRDRERAARAAYARANRHIWIASGHRRRGRKLNATLMPIAPEALAARWSYWAGRCWICGGEADTWDHVKPLSKGGAHCLANLRPACKPCNCRKQATWPFDAAA